MANPEAPRSQEESAASDSLITRRQVLGGMAGIAGVAATSSLLAACGPGTASTAPAPSSGGSAPAPSTGGSAPAASLSGEVTLGSNYSDAVPKAVRKKVFQPWSVLIVFTSADMS